SSRAWAAGSPWRSAVWANTACVMPDSRISPSATGCSPPVPMRITRPFGIKIFVVIIVIDTNYLTRTETDHGVHRGRNRLPAFPAAGQDRHRRSRRAAGRGAGRVRVRRDLLVRRRAGAGADQEVPQR